MKLSIFAFLIASVSARTISKKNAAKVLGNARRLGDDGGEYEFLMAYKLKMRQCIAGEAIRDPESGEYEYNAVVFRLCPDDGNCDDESTDGCGEGYGDFVVGLKQFVEGYMQDQEENMQYDDNFNVAEYAECREYENNNNDDGNGVQYYIGPACTEDGTDVKLELYYDEACSYVPEEVTFEDISNGWSMPFGEGGLVSSYCTSCTNYDNGNYELKEFCERLYENSGKCETNMEMSSYYGKQEGACEYILELIPAASTGGAGKVIGWLFFIAVVALLSGYVVWWKKKKAANNANAGLMA